MNYITSEFYYIIYIHLEIYETDHLWFAYSKNLVIYSAFSRSLWSLCIKRWYGCLSSIAYAIPSSFNHSFYLQWLLQCVQFILSVLWGSACIFFSIPIIIIFEYCIIMISIGIEYFYIFSWNNLIYYTCLLFYKFFIYSGVCVCNEIWLLDIAIQLWGHKMCDN